MKKLEDAVWLIKENPNKYIGKKSLENLYSFINGYIKCQYIKDGTYPMWPEEFLEYLQEKFDIKMCINVPTILRRISLSDEDAFDVFYELLSTFFLTRKDENL